MSNVFTTIRDNFSPLRIRNFRIYLSGQALSLIGTWLQLTAQSWVVWELSHSESALGYVGMLGTLPVLILGPWGGVLADQTDRRKLLLATQISAMMLAFVLAFLTFMGWIQLWHVYILSTLLGITTAIDFPTQQAFIGDLSGMGEVRKAVNLNATILQVSRMIGPAIAGAMLASWGAATVFGINGLSFLAVIFSLLLLTTNQVRRTTTGSPTQEFMEAWRFIKTQPRIQDLIIFVVLITFLVLPMMTILPSVATKGLGGGADTLGYLMSASGAGALIGALVLVPLAQAQPRTGVIMSIAALWMASGMIAFSFSRYILLSCAIMLGVSMAAPVIFTMSLGLIQVLTPLDMRSRMLSFFVTLSFGLQPFSSLLIGQSAERLGSFEAIRLNGVLLIIATVLMMTLRTNLIQWDVSHQLAQMANPVVEHPPL